MNKRHVILILILSLLTIILLYLFFPRSIKNAVLIKSDSNNTIVYINGKIETINLKDIKQAPNTVISYQYNYFNIYNVTEVKPIEHRILLKNNDQVEVESIGLLELSEKACYYKVTDSKLAPCSSTDLIIGKNNVKCYKDRRGRLSTFIIYSVNEYNTRVSISNSNLTSLYHKKIQVICPNPITLYSLIEKHEETIPQNTVVNLDETTHGIKVSVGDGASKEFKGRIYIKGSDIQILSIKRGLPEFNPAYSGVLEFNKFSDGILIVNELNIEDYLKKVVPNQMEDIGGIESLKCQAIASRTLAVSDILSTTYVNLGFYINDTSKSTLYNTKSQSTLANEAILATNGIILTHKKSLIDSRFFYTSCGTSVRYEDIWIKQDEATAAREYYRTVNFISSITSLPVDEASWLAFFKKLDYTTADTPSPYFRWNIKASKNALTSSLNKTILEIYNKDYNNLTLLDRNGKIIHDFPNFGNLNDIQVVTRSRGGNIVSLKIIFENASVILFGDEEIEAALKFNKEYTNDTSVLNKLNSPSIENPSNTPSRFFSIEKSGDTYTFYGGGYGHGVGMSQYGAMELSKKHWDFKSILNVYYKDIEYTDLY